MFFRTSTKLLIQTLYFTNKQCFLSTAITNHKLRSTLPTTMLNATRIYDIQKEINPAILRVHTQLERKSGVSEYNIPRQINPNFPLINQSNFMTEKTNIEYQCPTKSLPWVEILDIVNTAVGMYDCPNSSNTDIDLILPTMQFFNDLNIERECPGIEKPEKLARKKVRKCYRLLRTRERKMNRHKLVKTRKKLKFLHRKLKAIKNKKKETKILSEINVVLAKVDAYDPLASIKEEIRLARKGGYRIDVFGDRASRK